MPQPKKAFEEARIPFTKMTYSPDVPSTQLGPNEYNAGVNVETDVRGIRSVLGDEIILKSVPGTPTFVSGGFRQPIPGQENDFWFVVANTEGEWWCNNGEGDWLEITNGAGPFTTYNQATNITEAWSGTVPFYNDEANPPQFWPEFEGVGFPITAISGNGTTVTATFTNQADEITGVTIADHEGRFVYTNGAALKAGQRVTISGTNTNTIDQRIPDVGVAGLNGQFACDSFTAPAEFTASIAGTTMTVTAVASGNILENMDLDGTGLAANTRIVNQLTGTAFSTGTYTITPTQTVAATTITGVRPAGMSVGQTVTVSGTVSTSNQTLSNVKLTSLSGDFSCNSATLTEGARVAVSGAISNTAQTLSTVSINSVTGDFSCAAATLSVGQKLTVSGTISNTPTVLGTVAAVGNTGQFQCAATSLQVGQVVRVDGVAPTSPIVLTGVAIAGTVGDFTCTAATLYVGQIITISGTLGGTGSITGYTNPTTYKISVTNGSTTFTIVELDGTAVVTTAGTPTGLTYTIDPFLIAGYQNPTSYRISATNGTTTFTLVNLTGSPIATSGGSATPLTFTVQVPEINGYTTPTQYVIGATNGSTTFTLATLAGEAITTQGGIPTGLTFTVQIPSITGYTNPTDYIIQATNGTTTFRLYTIVVVDGEEVLGSPLTTAGGAITGLTFVVEAASITGYSNPTNYYISETNGSTTFTLVDGNGDAIATQGGATTGLTFALQAPEIVGYSNPSTYFIVAANGTNQFQLSTTSGGSPITTNGGSPAGLVYTYTPFAVGQDIIVRATVPEAYRGTYTVTAVTASTVSWASATQGAATVLGGVSDTMPVMIMYSNTLPISIYDIVYESPTEQKIILSSTQLLAPYSNGDYIIISGVNTFFNGVFLVTSSTIDEIIYEAAPLGNFPGPGTGGTVSPQYAWNFNPNWKSVYAKFMRIYNTPNVGSILIAGNLTATDLDNTVLEFPTTVQWSQAFGLNQAPLTWEPTVTNVANQLDMPLRGGGLDAFPCNGQLFVCSYWDTVVLSPINYSTTSTPILGVRQFNQGRGILSSNCWTNADKVVYGVDARDIWVFDGNDFQGIANQRVKNWFYNQIDQRYIDRIYMDTNSAKNQIEIYYPTQPPVIESITITDTQGTFTCNILTTVGGPLRLGLQVQLSGTESGTGSISGYNPAGSTYYVIQTNGLDTFQLATTPTGSAITTTAGTVTGVEFRFISDGIPNMMLSYRYDLDCWNAPREVQSATMSCEAPFWSTQQWYYGVSGTTLTGSGTGARFNIQNNIVSYGGFPTPNVRGSGYAVGNTVRILGTALGGQTPANDAVITVTAVDGPGRIVSFTATGTPLQTWYYDPGRRTIVYARGLLNRNLVQKDDGYNFLGPQLEEYPIRSQFRRDNIRILPNYSGKLLVHRILPEINNLNKYNLPIDPVQEDNRIGTVDIRIEGAESVGQTPVETTALTISTDTDYPWVQMNQNAHRVNSIEISHSSTDNIWICAATTWQFTQTEDDR